jgi:hypothetical protein
LTHPPITTRTRCTHQPPHAQPNPQQQQQGKSTLLKLMARRQIPVPDNIDVLLVEQEVVGMDDQTALQAVVAADVELMELR